MAKRKTVTRGEDPLALNVSQLKRRCMEDNVSARVATSAQGSGRVSEASCCSSIGSESILEQERIGNVDLVHKIHVDSVEEVETINSELDNGYRRDSTSSSGSSSGEMDKSPEKKSPPPKTPPADEIEKFFTTVEKQEVKQYTEKYNFDFAKDVPLEGRYEWVPIKP